MALLFRVLCPLASLLLDMTLDNDTDYYSIVVSSENLLLEFLPE